MLIQNHEPFGNFKPGDVIEIPDKAIFDKTYWHEAPKGAEVNWPPKAGDETPAAKPRYGGSK